MVSDSILPAPQRENLGEKPRTVLHYSQCGRGRPIREVDFPRDISPRCEATRGLAPIREDQQHHQTIQTELHQDQLPVPVDGGTQPKVHSVHRRVHVLDLHNGHCERPGH